MKKQLTWGLNMFFRNEKNWKGFLSLSDEEEMNRILERTAKYRPAYKNAEDVKMAQLWCALLEMRKDTLNLNKRLERIEFILQGMFDREEKKRQELLDSLRKF